MATVMKKQSPEEFALEILDGLMEGEKELSPLQLLYAANAYATAGMAINARAKSVTINNFGAASPEQEESDEYEGFEPAYKYRDAEAVPPGYVLMWSGKGRYWVNPTLPYSTLTGYIDSLPDRDPVVEAEADRIAAENQHLIKQKDVTRTLGDESVTIPGKTEDNLKPKNEQDSEEEGELVHVPVTTSPWLGPVGSEVLHDEILSPELQEFLQDATMAEAIEAAYPSSAYSYLGRDGKPIVFQEDVYTKEPTRELPQTLRERIEAEISARKEGETNDES